MIASSCNHLRVWDGEVNVTPRERESIAQCGTGALTAEVVPDEKLHDEPDDDTHREKVPPKPGEGVTPQAKAQLAPAPGAVTP